MDIENWELRGKPALLIMHMQYGMVGKYLDSLIPESEILIKQLALLEAFRSKGLPVIYINVMKRPPVIGPLPAYGFLWREHEKPETDPKNSEVIIEVKPRPDEPVLVNWPFTGFNNSGLDQALKNVNVDTLVMAGFTTNGVVFGTAQEAANRFYSVIIPNDASASPSAEAHKVVMELMAPAFALVTSTEDIIAHL